MKWHRIYGLVLRYWYYLIRSFDRLSDMFYWPTIDLILFGLTGDFVQKNSVGLPNVIFTLLSGVILWIIVWRGQYEITVNFLEELWNRNLINIFVSPVQFREWVVSVLIVGIIKMSMSAVFSAILGYLFYKINILNYGLYLAPFTLSLLFTGWAVGLFIAGIIIRYGTKLQTLAWASVAVLSPFSAVYYPLATLPQWAQGIAKFVPPSYIFENARTYIQSGQVNLWEIALSFILNIVYCILGLMFLYSSFKSAKQRGLIKVY